VKILVTGSREWKDAPDVREHFRACLLAQSTTPGILVHGGQRGADLIMATVAAALGWEIRPYPVDPARDGSWPEAGPKRNARMLRDEHLENERVDLCLAFPLPGSRGTWDMLRKANHAGIRCVVKDEPRIPNTASSSDSLLTHKP